MQLTPSLPLAPLRPHASTTCEHCGGAVPGTERFCCSGCRAVHDLLVGEGLSRYYDLRGGAVAPVALGPATDADAAWLELAARRLALSGAGLHAVALDLQGISCTACVWLIDEVFRRMGVAGRVEVNATRGSLDLWVERDFDLVAFVRELARFGYRAGPRRGTPAAESDDLLTRTGICAAIAMNAMLFAIARYAGLADPATVRLFHLLELGLAAAAFLVGGTVFVVGAARALRRGILHLDLPIALGIVLGYAGSIASLVVSDGRDSYLDTLVVFTTLMLAGRLLRQRIVARNRAQILDDAGAEAMLVRRVTAHADGHETVDIVPATTIRRGDVLLVAPGDVVPVAAELVDRARTVSHEWITGEAEPATVLRGQTVVAGTSVAGGVAGRFRAREDLAASALLDLLRTTPAGRDEPGRLERRVASIWVPFVLVSAAAGFVGWSLVTGDLVRALAVTVGLLVVTCPCAFGIATPLGHEIVLAELRRRGLLVRSAGFLERAALAAKVVFDKTGTLTTGQLQVEDAAAISDLAPRELGILHQLAVRSGHPKSAAIVASIPAEKRLLDASIEVSEVTGRGVQAEIEGVTYRLGAPSFAAPGDRADAPAGGDVVFSAQGVALARIATAEVLRRDAKEEVAALEREGLEVWMLTGDSPARARDLAEVAGIDAARVVAGCSPDDKASFLRARDAGDTVFLGDGINDAPAAAVATCSGTPAAGRTFLAARSDFYLLGDGLAGVRLALRGARALRQRTRKNLRLAVVYNAVALGLCFGGLMSPLAAAVLMPVSSILAVSLTVRDLSRKDAKWKS